MENNVYLIDCMEYMKTCKNNEFDLAIVDPPYGIGINKSGRVGHYGGKGKDWDNSIPNDSFFNDLLRISKNSIIWGGNYFMLPPSPCFLIWDKKQPAGVSFASCEFAWTNFDGVAKTFYMSPMNADKDGRIHPTQKPVALYKWPLQNYAKQGQTIFDSHVGSGSSRIACHDMGFDFTGCELDPDYWQAQEDRYKKHSSQGELFEFNGGVL